MNGHALLERRNRLGLSQAQLADLLGVHWTTISRWERGARRMDVPRSEWLDRKLKEMEERMQREEVPAL